MGDSVDNPDDSELLEEAIRFVLGSVHTSIPARILSYKHGKKPRATVRPVIRFSFRDPDTEERVPFLPEAVSNVPVLFPSSTNHSDTWPLEKGDPVYLLIAERSLDEWLSSNRTDNVPQDPRRFDLTDAVALPVLGAGELPADAFDATKRVIRGAMLLGSANATDFVALASLVSSELGDIALSLAPMIAAFNLPAGTPLVGLGPGVVPVYVPGSVAAGKVQAE